MAENTYKIIPQFQNDSARVGAVTRSNRFMYLVENGEIRNVGTSGIDDFSNADFVKLQAAVARLAPSVGKVLVRKDLHSAAFGIGTCFCVSNGTGAQSNRFRVLTNNHLLWGILSNRATLVRGSERSAYYLPRIVRGYELPTEAEFEINGQKQRYPLEKIIWSHAKWDLLLLEFEIPHGAPKPVPLEIATHMPPTNWQAEANSNASSLKTFVLGYPCRNAIGNHETNAMRSQIGKLTLSAGLAKNYSPVSNFVSGNAKYYQYVIEHDCSTLNGHSGAPVFDLESGKVIGLHYRGGNFEGNLGASEMPTNANKAFVLPEIIKEARLLGEIRFDNHANQLGSPRTDWGGDRQPRYIGAGGSIEDFETAIQVNFIQPSALNVVINDRTDFRDVIYEPRLLQPPDEYLPESDATLRIHNQGNSAGCVAHALAALIERQSLMLERENREISAQMLYENAKKFDNWLNDSIPGTSLRGAIKGFYTNGACSEKFAPSRHLGTSNFRFTCDMMRDAKKTRLGGYMRIRPRLRDFQNAIFEGGAVIVSAKIHAGWMQKKKRIKKIPHRKTEIGRHAFLIIGYNSRGFIIQNSWGDEWGGYEGRAGTALWTYEDWADNVMDAWAIRLAPSLEVADASLLHFSERNDANNNSTAFPNLPKARMSEVIGNIVPVERDTIVSNGKFGIGLGTLHETRQFLEKDIGRHQQYDALALVFVEPFWSIDDVSKLIRHLKPMFKKKKIYPLFIYDGGAEMRIMRALLRDEIQTAIKPFEETPQDLTPYLLEQAAALILELLTEFIEHRKLNATEGPLSQILELFEDVFKKRRLVLVSYGTGAIAASSALGQIEEKFGRSVDAQFHYEAFDATSLCTQSTRPSGFAMLANGANNLPRLSCPILQPFLGDFMDLIHAAYSPNRDDQLLQYEAEENDNVRLIETHHRLLANLATDPEIISEMFRGLR